MGGVPVVSAHENNVFPFSSTNYFSVKRLIEQIKEPVTGLPCVLWTISYSWDHIFSTTNAGLEIFTCSSHKHQQLGSVITNLLSPPMFIWSHNIDKVVFHLQSLQVKANTLLLFSL